MSVLDGFCYGANNLNYKSLNKKIDFKDGDTFYYVLLNKVTNQYYVMRYQYWDELDHCFNHDLMFKTEYDAEQKAIQMNKN